MLAPPVLAASAPPDRLVVVTDDNYPPYLFRSGNGQLQGIVMDKWALWSRTTGVPVKVEGLAWNDAQQRLRAGGADVIDALAYTAARAAVYEFSRSYATVEARVFFHRTISGINQAPSLRGFTIGAKEGSACATWLETQGIDTIRKFAASEALVQAAGAGEIRLFCMDSPTAQYFLFKHALADDFRQTAPLYSTSFHWAVAGGRAELRDFIQRGYDRVPAQALSDIDDRWLGSPLRLPIDPRYFYYFAAFATAVFFGGALMLLWNRTLQRRIADKTSDLNAQNQERARLVHDLGERVKELRVLHATARLLQTEDAVDRELLDELARLLPPGWQFPEICVARIVYGSIEAQTPGWRETAWRQSARFATGDGQAGLIEVAYLEERPADAEGPFLQEERRLIDSLAELVGEHFEHARIESALRESEARVRLAVHASSIGLWDWDIAGNQLYYSPEWKSQLGHAEDEIEHTFGAWRDRLHPEDRERMLPKVQAYLADPRGPYDAEFRLRHKNGSYRWIYARAHVETDAEGRPQRMLGCHIDITERKRAESELQQSFSRLQDLSRRLVEVEESERRNINRELHDRVGQNLSALNLSLGILQNGLAGGTSPELDARLDDARMLLEMTSKQVRDVMADLRPAALDDYGLLAALRHHGATVAARLSIPNAVEGQDLEPRLPPAVETALFRIAQEALNNVAKHARARSVKIVLGEMARRVTLSVTDDGAGFDIARAGRDTASYGIMTMNERAEALGARLRVVSAPGEGTRVEVVVERAAK